MSAQSTRATRCAIAIAVGAALLGALATTPAGAQDAPQPRPERPNILLIIGDDIGFDVTTNMYPGAIDALVEQYGPSGLNHPRYSEIAGRPASTPVLDRLARQSMTFAHAWAEPFCSPTRASLLTGLFAAKTHVLSYADALSQTHHSFVRDLHDDGYATAVFGKWHMAGLGDFPGMKPKEAGFDVFRGGLSAAIRNYWDYDYQIQDADTAAGEWRTETAPMRSIPGVAPTTYAPVVKAADTLDWIAAQEAADPDKPWFVWLAFNLSHATAGRAPSQMAIPNADTLDDEAREEMEACGGVFGTQDPGGCSGESQMRAMTNSVDTVIGKVLDGVDAIDPNAYVIYIADNGTPMYGRPNLDFIDNMYLTRSGRGKGTAYESGARVAMAVRGPGVPAGATSDAYVDTADLFATILDLAGLEAPANVPNSAGDGDVAVDSVSLAPILFGNASSVRDPNEGYLLTESLNLMTQGSKQVGARNATYKVICSENADPDSCAFYNLVEDPLEEYPLDKPASCEGDAAAARTPDDPEWHYCRLTDVIRTQSFL